MKEQSTINLTDWYPVSKLVRSGLYERGLFEGPILKRGNNGETEVYGGSLLAYLAEKEGRELSLETGIEVNTLAESLGDPSLVERINGSDVVHAKMIGSLEVRYVPLGRLNLISAYLQYNSGNNAKKGITADQLPASRVSVKLQDLQYLRDHASAEVSVLAEKLKIAEIEVELLLAKYQLQKFTPVQLIELRDRYVWAGEGIRVSKFTDEEKQILVKMYPVSPLTLLVEVLGKESAEIEKIAGALGLKRIVPNREYDIWEVMAATGKSFSFLRRDMRSGLLKTRRYGGDSEEGDEEDLYFGGEEGKVKVSGEDLLEYAANLDLPRKIVRTRGERLSREKEEGLNEKEKQLREKTADEHRGTLAQYLDQMSRIPLLTKEEELALATEFAQTGSERAFEELVEANLRLVVKYARRFWATGKLKLDDYIQYGNIGLMKGIRSFEPERGYKLSTYVTWWIRQAIQRGIADDSRDIRVPVHIQEGYSRIRKTRNRIVRVEGRNPSDEEIANILELPLGHVRKVTGLFRTATNVSSLQDPIRSSEDEDALEDYVPDKAILSPEEAASGKELHERIEEALEHLTPNERLVIEHRFLYGDDELEFIGARMGVTRERIRQWEAKAKKKLAHSLKGTGVTRK
ncbi:MAG: sigma-70 family RNA polymerase sigma factor [Candidatus Nanoarchaeia archaeon]